MAENEVTTIASPVENTNGAGSSLLNTCFGLMNLGERGLDPHMLLALLSLVNLADILALVNGSRNLSLQGSPANNERQILGTLSSLLGNKGRSGGDKGELLSSLLGMLGGRGDGGNLDMNKIAPLIGVVSSLLSNANKNKSQDNAPLKAEDCREIASTSERSGADIGERTEGYKTRPSGWARIGR